MFFLIIKIIISSFVSIKLSIYFYNYFIMKLLNEEEKQNEFA